MHTHICRLSFYTLAATMLLALPPASPAQEAAQPTVAATPSIVPHLIKYSGALPGAPNTTNTVDVKFALYAAQIGGEEQAGIELGFREIGLVQHPMGKIGARQIMSAQRKLRQIMLR